MLVILTSPDQTSLSAILHAVLHAVSKFILHLNLALLHAWTHHCQDLVLSYAWCVCYSMLQTECSVPMKFGQHACGHDL